MMYKGNCEKESGMPGWLLVFADIVISGIVLLVFAYYHHVKPLESNLNDDVLLPTPTISVSSPQPTTTTETVQTPEQTADSHVFADKFLAEGLPAEHTDTTYVTQNVNVSVMTFHEYNTAIHVAEIYVRDVQFIKTSAGGGDFKQAWENRVRVDEMSRQVNAFVAVNGDQFAARKEGVTVRNGILYRSKTYHDACVLQYDGELVTYPQSGFSVDTIADEGAWQVWSFGPMLLEDGQPMTDFNCESNLQGHNPRTAIGMIEPLHYLIITVDGRQHSSGSDGISLKDLSQWFYDHGCTVAYNLDGGATAQMAVNSELYSSPSKERECTDIIYIGIE